MPQDFYSLLDVPRTASPEEVKRAYRRTVRDYHPDVNDDDRATAQFKVVHEAYEVLSDPAEREKYDRLGHERYVAKELGGLPTRDAPGDREGGGRARARRASAGRTRRATSTAAGGGSTARTGRSRSSGGRTTANDGRTGSDDDAGRSSGSTAAAGGDTRRRRRYGDTDRPRYRRRAPPRWTRRDVATHGAVGITALGYVAGLVGFGVANAAGIGSLGAAIDRGGVEAIVAAFAGARHGVPTAATVVGSTANTLGAPTATVEALVPVVLVVGALLLPATLALAARRTGERPAHAGAALALGPVAGLVAGLATTPGVGVDAAAFGLAPAGAIAGWLWAVARDRSG